MSESTQISNIPLQDRYNPEKIIGTDIDEYTYSRMPVSSFGMSMLHEMGFYEGRGLGKNPENALHHPVEFVPRHHRQGLGADPKPSFLQKKKNNLNDKNLVAPLDENGKSKNFIKIGDKLIEKKKRKKEVGVFVKIIKGKHDQMEGKIISLNEEKNECVVQLVINEENIKIKIDDVSLIDKGEDDFKKEKFEILNKKISKKNDDNKKSDSDKKRKIKWVMPNIKVRITSKKYKDGKYYNTKVLINDIMDAYSFSVINSKGDILYDLKEKEIETVLPDLEKNVIILKGENKGKIAILKLRDKNKNKVIVQLIDTFEYEELTQDDVCEYENK